MEMNEVRLASIENKLDKLTEAISRLAVVDERLTNLIVENTKISLKVSDLSKAVNEHEVDIAGNKVVVERLERLAWLIGGAVIVALVKAFIG